MCKVGGADTAFQLLEQNILNIVATLAQASADAGSFASRPLYGACGTPFLDSKRGVCPLFFLMFILSSGSVALLGEFAQCEPGSGNPSV